ncbi:hypothetical protein HYT56_03500 [Candidatus Woesearchaeota archaeon]|nr:hypothetical protein [Candidatus Woesearchaeota archaeon]
METKDKSYRIYDLKQEKLSEEERIKWQRIYAEAELSDLVWRLKNYNR